MWPFSEMSLPVASLVGTIANWLLLASLIGGVLSTFVIVKTSDVKEEHWAEDRRISNEHIARLNNDATRLTADNLALQTALLPRHAGLFGLDRAPPASEWFAGIKPYAGTELFIQVTDDKEAKNLAGEIAIIVSRFGWRPVFIDEKRSQLESSKLADGVDVSYPIGKPWTAEEPNQPWIVWSRAAESLANALTAAGLGVGDKPVSRFGFTNQLPQFPGLGAYFDPPIEGVYLQVGARPVAETVEWIKQGRPDRLGNKPAGGVPAEPHKKPPQEAPS
jgi:hypothetical protein